MPPLSIMIKPASSLCNMACEYCFYNDVVSSREKMSFGIMEKSTVDSIISKAIHFTNGDEIAFAFQGGEPLLAGLKFFEYFVKTLKDKNILSSPIFLSLQTNGTLITDEWADFFARENFLVGLSLDGDSEANRFRKNKAGSREFSRIVAAASLLKKKNVDFNILSVLTGYSADNIDRIHGFFKKMGYKYIQFIPCLRPFGDKSESSHYMSVEQYKLFLVHEFNNYVKDYIRGEYMSIRQFDNWVQMYLGREPEQCGMCGHCMHQFVVEGNGNIYPCDFYCLDEWLLGNINGDSTFETMAIGEVATKFISESLNADEECIQCKYYPLCRAGGCKRSRIDRDYCEAYKAFFSSCLPLFRAFINE